MMALEKGLISQEALNECLSALSDEGGRTMMDLFRTKALLSEDQIVSLHQEAVRRVRGRQDPSAPPPADPSEAPTAQARTVAVAPPAPKEEEDAIVLQPDEAPPPPAAVPVEAVRAANDPFNNFGKFILVQQVGKGSLGSVWKAWDTPRGRWVTVKILKDGGASIGDLPKFLADAGLTAAVNLPGVVAPLEGGTVKRGETEEAYVSLEFVEGETLEQVRSRGIPLKRAAEIMRDAAMAVASAHQNGLIHRDIKPRNIMVGFDGRISVTDFGLAMHAGTLGPGDEDINLSREVRVIGTPSYMSPEQALGRIADINERSDVYSLGATLYYLVTGKPPFDSGQPMKTVIAVVQDDPKPPSSLNPLVNQDLERIVMRTLAKDAVRRYESAAVLAADLDRYAQGVPILSDDQMRYTQGLRALESGRLEEAIHMFKDLIRLEGTGHGEDLGAEKVLAEIKSGEEGLTLAIGRQTKNYHIRTQRGILRFARAIIQSLDGADASASCKESLDDFVVATSLRPESPAARVNRANILIFGGRYARDSGKDVSSVFGMALKDLTVGIEFDATSSHAYHNRGIVHFYMARAMKKGSGDPEPFYRKAIEDFSRAAELEPTYAYVFKDLGVAKVSLAKHMLVLGQKVKNLFVEAVMVLDMACKLNPTIYGAFYERGQAHFALKDFKSAIRDFKRCLDLDPARDRKVQALIDEAQKHLDSRKY